MLRGVLIQDVLGVRLRSLLLSRLSGESFHRISSTTLPIFKANHKEEGLGGEEEAPEKEQALGVDPEHTWRTARFSANLLLKDQGGGRRASCTAAVSWL